MPIFKEITAARKKLYLESLAETGCYAEAIKAAGVSGSLPHYWRQTDSSFVVAEGQAKARAAKNLLREGKLRQGKRH
jgi:uncharacterized protein (UPF0548 family)